ncbi:NAD(P)H-binding protein [Micromonospora polyrhachis]|uniref:Nucleoside-diphosphate-sugar epimerase n=1 Tax=Micromonospora polyrhachis TaxID=1282883 RepID=A0A7W7SRW1_9ACTN|nr:NAD-dependent epimerase/dehydratase family protein [Micromonospora polyrhachis]MBB4959828.1 nucleoside-diphosphate-sugar epimerase [Micromonospora polyrhachis]
MTETALVVGASGQIGRAAVRALVGDGWQVRAGARGVRASDPWPVDWGVESVRLDRDDDSQLADALGDGVDVVVDTMAMNASHAHQLLRMADRIGSAVVVSTAAVYLDDQGQGFGEEGVRFPVPIVESQPTVEPGEGSYPTEKAAMERELSTAGVTLPTTLLRAGAIHGPHTRHPREWYFVKRALDGRPVRILAYRGQSRFQPVSTVNLAELIRLAAARPGSRVLNAADPQAPTVREIGAAVHAVLDHDAEEVLVDGPSPVFPVGITPWTVPEPVVLDMAAAERELGYRPVSSYLDSLPETVAWLVAAARGRDWTDVFPDLAHNYQTDFFDYPAEDAWLGR